VDFSRLLPLVEEAVRQPLVLVVDDDHELCENLWDILRERGFRVALAHDEREVSGQLQGGTFQLVLIDMKLPSGDGRQVLKMVQKANPEARTVLTTGSLLLGIRLDLASVAHPQSNGQVERANGLILAGVKPRLVEPLVRSPSSWLDELPVVLWSLRTTPNRSTGFTPFFLVYGAEAIIPTDVEFDSPRMTMYTEAKAKEAREDGVDLLEEAGLLALSRSAIYQQGLRHYHSKKNKPLAFREGDLVL
jgi:CheY-like chemotaxis protein